MSSPLRTPRATRPLVAMLLVGIVALGAPAAGPAQAATVDVTADPEVQGAQQALDEAMARMAATQARLDDLAASFESARGHAERLDDDLGDASTRVEDAEAALDAARAAQAAEVRAAYMRPGADLLRVPAAFLLAPDTRTALHGSAMMQRVAANRAAQADAARRARRQVTDDVRTQQGVASGASAAMADLDQLAATFTLALDAAAADVAAAEAGLADAQQAAEARAQAEAEAAAVAAMGFDGVVAAPAGDVVPPGVRIATINGGTQPMACPLGQPNGFIDSWGFPRSGGRRHQGVDMFAAYGMPIFAAADGVVRRVFNNALGGLSIDLVDQLGNRYYYAHLSATYVVAGQPVQVGQLLAANGNSGNARYTPPHLHWQFHPGDGPPVNPYPLAAALCR